MLKVIRWEHQIRLEATEQSLETWLGIRVLIAVGCGERLVIEPGELTLDLPQITDPSSEVKGGRIRLTGVWLGSDPKTQAGWGVGGSHESPFGRTDGEPVESDLSATAGVVR